MTLSASQGSTALPDKSTQQSAQTDIITADEAGTLAGLFRERVRRSPEAIAYLDYSRDGEQWKDYTWAQMAREVGRWQVALKSEGLQPGDRVALQLRNCRYWTIFDIAALSLGLVVVPLYVADRPDNVAYILENADCSLLLLEDVADWQSLAPHYEELSALKRIVVLNGSAHGGDATVVNAVAWLPGDGRQPFFHASAPDDLATVVYTSGTTGRPKGVMLSNRNIVTNAWAGLRTTPLTTDNIFLSFLPLSHTLERTVGYYMSMMCGATVAFARSIPDLPEDLLTIRPTVMVSVPRIFERVYGNIQAKLSEASPIKRWLFNSAIRVGWRRFEWLQGRGVPYPSIVLWPLLDSLVAAKVRAGLGGRLRIAISGGAPLPPSVSRVFISLGVPIVQGYGLTESSPIISVNRLDQNVPASIGTPLPGVEVRIGKQDELLARGDNIMLGYWKNEEATRAVLDADGWLHTGDKARIDNEVIYITGRLKEIIVLANGEKVPPADMESAIAEDGLFEQSLVVGECMPYLAALVVLNSGMWRELAHSAGIDPDSPNALRQPAVEQALQARISKQIHNFPGYAQIRRVAATLNPWTIDNGLLTPTMKLKRAEICSYHQGDLDHLYAGHITL